MKADIFYEPSKHSAIGRLKAAFYIMVLSPLSNNPFMYAEKDKNFSLQIKFLSLSMAWIFLGVGSLSKYSKMDKVKTS